MADMMRSLAILLGSVLLATISATAEREPLRDTVRKAPARIVPRDEKASVADVELSREWDGDRCRAKLTNKGKEVVRIKEVVLFAIPLELSEDTPLYGEGSQMLTQTGGTLGKPVPIGGYTDAKHYRLPQPADATTVYSLLTLSPLKADHLLFAFSSSRRFIGKFHVRPKSIEVVIDTEGLSLAPGESWTLEEFVFASGPGRPELLAALAERIAVHHPPILPKTEPTGWCSWYCFGPRVTSKQVLDNLDVIAKSVPDLKNVLIDDGYQAAMGDWLEAGKAFGGDVRPVLKRIADRGFQPAIWVAPFIAEANSRLFKDHPDWFVQGDDGKPLPSDRVTFGGWRHGPWYALDGTHPGVQKHLEKVFATMRKEWGCTFFKLDANFWGALPGGRFHDAKATRVEAYRRGMDAIRKGAGDGFLLGCNHPIWPSLGLIHGSRSSSDVKRDWGKFKRLAHENLSRNWQNGRLWWNDPDCLLLTGDLSDDEYRYHATSIFASGGMLLSGDDLTKITPARMAMLKKLAPPTGKGAVFADTAMRVGQVRLKGRTAICLLNDSDKPATLSFKLPEASMVRDFWTDEDLGRREGVVEVKDMPAHSARLLICTPANDGG
jgi:alpha-galactosidase